MAVKLIVLDLDGTFLQNYYFPHPDNLKAIEKAHAMNIKVVFATGRTPLATIRHAKKSYLHKNSGYIICYNGANIIDISQDKFTFIYEKAMKVALVKEIINYANKNNISTWCYSAILGLSFVNKFSIKSFMLKLFYGYKIKLINDDNNLEVFKILFFIRKKKNVARICEELKQQFDIEVTTSSHNVIEINAAGVSKLEAVKFLCDRWGIELDEVLACGDGINDYELIKAVKYGIAMENGAEELKKVAYYVTDKNTKGGVAKAIEKFVFNNKTK